VSSFKVINNPSRLRRGIKLGIEILSASQIERRAAQLSAADYYYYSAPQGPRFAHSRAAHLWALVLIYGEFRIQRIMKFVGVFKNYETWAFVYFRPISLSVGNKSFGAHVPLGEVRLSKRLYWIGWATHPPGFSVRNSLVCLIICWRIEFVGRLL